MGKSEGQQFHLMQFLFQGLSNWEFRMFSFVFRRDTLCLSSLQMAVSPEWGPIPQDRLYPASPIPTLAPDLTLSWLRVEVFLGVLLLILISLTLVCLIVHLIRNTLCFARIERNVPSVANSATLSSIAASV